MRIFPKIRLNHGGFTLTETILVLLVAGLIVGGIFVSYSAATRAKKTAIMEQQITDLLQVVRNYALQFNENTCDGTGLYNTCSASGNDISGTLASKTLLPPSASSTDGGSPPKLKLEYGTGSSLRLYASSANSYGSGPVIGLIIPGLSVVDCGALAADWPGNPDKVSRSGLIAAIFNSTATTIPAAGNNILASALNTPNGSISSDDIVTGCTIPSTPGSSSIQMNLFFRLNP